MARRGKKCVLVPLDDEYSCFFWDEENKTCYYEELIPGLVPCEICPDQFEHKALFVVIGGIMMSMMLREYRTPGTIAEILKEIKRDTSENPR